MGNDCRVNYYIWSAPDRRCQCQRLAGAIRTADGTSVIWLEIEEVDCKSVALS